mmetsp:Transcript_13194/g.33839  ORF Transcript_13194/g.33839 Transcript_13194/m.33839 type:complete len:95 (-) Transcript_13194:256-540(-)
MNQKLQDPGTSSDGKIVTIEHTRGNVDCIKKKCASQVVLRFLFDICVIGACSMCSSMRRFHLLWWTDDLCPDTYSLRSSEVKVLINLPASLSSV